MREQRVIRFRAWLFKPKKMLYDFRGWFDMPEGRMVCIETEDSYLTDDFEKLSNKEARVMQYTGLKDKNGKEIYDGDILKSVVDSGTDQFPNEEELIEEVYFGGGAFYPISMQPPNAYEVIGNIYEDSHLLNK